ncbi:hypothetical protein BLNAU_18223 [Blattamonas nauphoetae]|uniref:Uncharacterized protein n=1 Tax=Blattamonas nauphoetae TaxID=2049346 RepID=A0ABQ9X579_9EUKA|nr:hypothetical protein BLNAU_18223 [Blattamonas nauphoetae]
MPSLDSCEVPQGSDNPSRTGRCTQAACSHGPNHIRQLPLLRSQDPVCVSPHAPCTCDPLPSSLTGGRAGGRRRNGLLPQQPSNRGLCEASPDPPPDSCQIDPIGEVS